MKHFHQPKRRPGLAPAILTLVAACSAGAASAQAVQPSAGSLLDQVREPQAPPPRPGPQVLPEQPREALRLPADVRFKVARIRITGNKTLPSSELDPLVAGTTGQEISLRELEQLAQRVTEAYRARGYALSRAYVPQQDIKGGEAEIAVIEGWLERVDLRNSSRIGDPTLARYLATVRTGEVLSEPELERALLLLNDLPGAQVRSTLKAGTRPGASVMEVQAEGDRALLSSVELDNFGGQSTGVARASLSTNWLSPLGLGEVFNLRLQGSEGLRYARAGAQLPVGGHGTRLNASVSRLTYRLGGSFAALNASGHADSASAGIGQTLLRSRVSNLNAALQYDHRSTRDLTGSTGADVRKTVNNWTGSLDGNIADALGGGGYNSATLGYVAGRLSLDPATAALDAASARSAGGFRKLTYSLQRIQRIDDRWELWLAHSGQTTGDNLDSSEKFSLSGVHAYPSGEASGDTGYASSAELKWRPLADWEFGAAYETGSVTINANPWAPGANHRRLAGVAVSATWSANGWRARAQAGWTAGTGAAVSGPDRKPRLWLQLSKSF